MDQRGRLRFENESATAWEAALKDLNLPGSDHVEQVALMLSLQEVRERAKPCSRIVLRSGRRGLVAGSRCRNIWMVTRMSSGSRA